MAEETVSVRLRAQVGEYMTAMGRARAATAGWGSQVATTVQRNQQMFTRVGVAATAMSGAVVLGFARASQAAAQFEATTTRMVTQIGLAESEMQQLSKAALNLGETGRGPQELGEAAFFVASAGERGAEALETMEVSAKAAAIGLGETRTVADLATSAVNAYGREVLDSVEATDVLVGAVREGKAEPAQFARAMGQVIPIASELGVQFNELGAATAAMTRTGTDAGTAATQLRQILAKLLRPTEMGREALEGVGLSAEMLRRQLGDDGLFSVLQRLTEAFEGNREGLGKVFEDVQALSGIYDLMGANVEETEGIFRRMTDTAGLTEEGFERWGETTEAAQQRFSAAMERLTIQVGTVFTPVMASAAETGSDLAGAISELPDPMRNVAVGAGGVASGFGLIVGAGALVLPQIVKVRQAVTSLGVASTATRTTLIGLGRFLANPWTIAIGGATAALLIFQRQQAASRERVEELTSAMRQQEDAVGSLTRSYLLQRIEGSRLAGIAEEIGLSATDIIGALEGEENALRRVTAAIDEQVSRQRAQGEAADLSAGQLVQLQQGLRELTEEVDRATRAFNREQIAQRELNGVLDAMNPRLRESVLTSRDLDQALANLPPHLRDTRDASEEAGEGSEEFAGAMGEVEGAAAAAKSAMDEYREAIDRLIGVTMRGQEAHRTWLETLEGLSDEIDDSNKSLELNTQAGRDNQRAIEESIQAIMDRGEALLEAGEHEDLVAARIQSMIGDLREQAEQAGITREDFDEYLETLDATPEEIRTEITADTDEAHAAVAALGRDLDFMTRDRQVRVGVARFPTGAASGMQVGGLVPGSGSGDTVPAMLEPGEFVIRQRAAETLGLPLLKRLNSGRVGGMAELASGGPVGPGADNCPFPEPMTIDIEAA